MTRSIILVGPVGAGKTELGTRLSAALGLRFVHIDEAAAAALGQPVSSAMITHPDECEAAQRRLSHHYLEMVTGPPAPAPTRQAMILALPPAASTDPSVSDAITAARLGGCLVVEMTIDVGELTRRLGLNGPRTVQLGAPRAMLTRMLAATHAHHATLADVTVTTVGHSIETVLQEVLAAL